MSINVREDDPGPAHEAASFAEKCQGKLHKAILEALDKPYTASELMERTGLHYNTLWRRLSELKKAGLVHNTDEEPRRNSRGFKETVVAKT